MNKNRKNIKLHKILKHILIAAVWLILWQILSSAVGLSVLLPSPLETLGSLGEMIKTRAFWRSVFYSILRISAGFVSGVILGTLAAVASSFSKTVNDFLLPLIEIIKATPVASFIILAVVWLKSGKVPSFTAALMVFPIVWSNVKTGVKETNKNLLEMSDAFSVRFLKKVAKIYIPSVKPYFISSLTTALGLSWKAGIAAEVICNPVNSIGGGIYSSKIYLDTPKLFAWTAVVVLMSISLEKILITILNKINK